MFTFSNQECPLKIYHLFFIACIFLFRAGPTNSREVGGIYSGPERREHTIIYLIMIFIIHLFYLEDEVQFT